MFQLKNYSNTPSFHFLPSYVRDGTLREETINFQHLMGCTMVFKCLFICIHSHLLGNPVSFLSEYGRFSVLLVVPFTLTRQVVISIVLLFFFFFFLLVCVCECLISYDVETDTSSDSNSFHGRRWFSWVDRCFMKMLKVKWRKECFQGMMMKSTRAKSQIHGKSNTNKMDVAHLVTNWIKWLFELLHHKHHWIFLYIRKVGRIKINS